MPDFDFSPYGLTGNLLGIAFCTAAVSYLVALLYLEPLKAIMVVLFKFSLPVIYFAFFFNGSWTFVDDFEYLRLGRELISQGYEPLTALISSEGRETLRSLAGGTHILYIWWNSLAENLFGSYYYSPVFLNIFLTFICGFVFSEILKLLDFNCKYRRQFLVFFLLQWDILAWSSIINQKDIMVMTLTMSALFFALRMVKKKSFVDLCCLLLICYISLWLRRYVPILLFISILIWLTLITKGRNRILLISSLAIIAAIFYSSFSSSFGFLSSVGFSGIVRAPFNIFRMSVTPQPWSIVDHKLFLLPVSIFHCVFYIPMIIGLIGLWKTSKEISLIIIYLAVGLIAFGASDLDLLQGPRHRIQFTFAIAIAQFHFLWILNSYLFKKRLAKSRFFYT